ncbi:MAG: GlsB/YeaQ/YmgE family stress response membrane protein [Limisphaerales bacterium]
MDLIITFFIGLIVGLVAKLIMPGRDPGGFIITALLGIAGAFVARMIGQAAGWYGPGEPAGFIAAVAGAVLLLFLYRLLFQSGSDRRVRG